MAELAGKRFESPDEVRKFTDNKGQVEVVDLNGHSVGRGTFAPGWRWSENVKPLAGTDSCQVEHIGYVLEGRMALKMDDGTELEFGPGDAFHSRLVMTPGSSATRPVSCSTSAASKATQLQAEKPLRSDRGLRRRHGACSRGERRAQLL